MNLFRQNSNGNSYTSSSLTLPVRSALKGGIKALKVTATEESKKYYSAPFSESADIVYHDNSTHVMTAGVNFYNIYYGDFSNSNYAISTPDLVDFFAAHIGGSSWYNILTAYYKRNKDNSVSYVSSSAKFLNRTIVLNPSPHFTELDVEKVINEQIFANKWNLDRKFDNEKAIFIFIFRGDFVVDGWLSTWCGYHSAFNIDGIGISKYAVIGDVSFSTIDMALGCIMKGFPTTPNGNVGGDSIVSIYAHEIAEVITDYYNDAWYFDLYHNEIAEMCAWNYGTNIDASYSNIKLGTRSFLIQSIYISPRSWLRHDECFYFHSNRRSNDYR